MRKYLVIFLASFLVFFTILGGVYYIYKSNITDKDFQKTIEENPELKPEDPKGEAVINTLFMGIDDARSDTMIVVSYNKENNNMVMLSVPRDTRVNIPGYGYDKINSAAARKEGTALAMETVGNLLGIPIHQYVKVDFKGAAKLVDILGGVKVNVPQDMDYDDPAQNLSIHLKKGIQVLNGANAVKFARYRSGYSDQDLGRIKAQQSLIKAVIDKLTSPAVIPKALSIADAASKCIKTNMPNSDIARYAMNLGKLKTDNIKFYTVPGEPKMIGKVAYYVHDEGKLKKLMEQISVELGVKTAELQATPTQEGGSAQESNAAEKTLDRKDIKIQILNSTNKGGLANQLRDELEAKGYQGIETGNIKDMTYSYSRVLDRRGDKEKLELVVKDTNISTVENDIDNTSDYDITIIIGKDRLNGGM
ncbi:MAG: LCP family protein [Caulobacteraceae bacterium]